MDAVLCSVSWSVGRFYKRKREIAVQRPGWMFMFPEETDKEEAASQKEYKEQLSELRECLNDALIDARTLDKILELSNESEYSHIGKRVDEWLELTNKLVEEIDSALNPES